MSKLTSYLKTFFMLVDSSVYESKAYRDYTGPLFGRYKKSLYFKPKGFINPGYTKAEVAAYSEMTKLALLIGCMILAWAVLTFDYWAIKLIILDHNFRETVSFIAYFGIVPLNYVGVGLIPRFIFLIKNFKDPNG
jgi:hypothetical protein